MTNKYAEENFPTEQPPAREKARLPGPDGDQERPGRSQAPSCEGTQEINGSALLGFGLPKAERLLKSSDFKRVYSNGRRFDGRWMTVFVLGSDLPVHRFGVTASRKLSTKSHDRNRAKRLVREAFRLSRQELSALSGKYDIVVNARRGLIGVKLDRPLVEFREIVARIEKLESRKGEPTFGKVE